MHFNFLRNLRVLSTQAPSYLRSAYNMLPTDSKLKDIYLFGTNWNSLNLSRDLDKTYLDSTA